MKEDIKQFLFHKQNKKMVKKKIKDILEIKYMA
jgi:hypothetical protein